MGFPIPVNEARRLEALASYGIWGTGPEAPFDDITRLTSQVTGAPICLISLIGENTAWVKSRVGVPTELNDVPRGAMCCAMTICQSDLLCIPDTHADDRSKALPFISTEPFVRFYAGMPLIDSGGYAIGSLCLMDLKPRELTFELGETLRLLSRQAVSQIEMRLRVDELRAAQAALEEERQRAEALIRNILPENIAQELRANGHVEPRHHPSATILFMDFADFTQTAERLSPRALVDDLHLYFSRFDDICAEQGLEKLKTIGDAYMAAGGLHGKRREHPIRTCLAALAARETMRKANEVRARQHQTPWELRIGIHTGSVMSGVVGKHKFTYDIWGDAVNVAARIEAAGEPGRINLSEATFQHVKKYFDCTPRGTLEMKHKAPMPMHFLDRLKPEYAADPEGTRANEALAKVIKGSELNWALPPGQQ
jgi:adenylate cyclase